MERINSLQSLVGYADYGGDSDEEIEDSDDEEATKENVQTSTAMAKPLFPPQQKKASSRLVSYGGDEEDDEQDMNEDDVQETTTENKDSLSTDNDAVINLKTATQDQTTNQETDKTLDQSKSIDSKPNESTIQLPPEPPGRCSNSLQDKINNLLEKRQRLGYDLNSNVQNRKDFRNPSIYEKLIQFCGITEIGTNYPKHIFDPTCWKEESFYDNLSKIQKERDKAKQERTQVEKKMGTKKTSLPVTTAATANSNTEGDPKRKKSKWDIQPS